jgi:hypothetical protein
MLLVQRDVDLKYYWARQGDGNSPRWQAKTNNESVQQMMRAATKRARVARAMAMVMRVVGNKEGKGNGNKCGRHQRRRGR